MANHFQFKDQTINVGDRVAVHLRIEEEGKSRTQVFEGLIIGTKGSGVNKTFTIRKIGANSIGVERIIPLISPFIEKMEVKTRGKVRRAKLNYLRGRVGRRALRVKEA